MTDAIDLTTEQRSQLTALLRRFLPGVAVWAYGSRVKWTARPNSDLDLVAFVTPAQRPQVSELQDALAESNLPFLVDLHVWDEEPERFREIIRKDYAVVQEAKEPEGKTRVPLEWQRHEVSKLLADGKLVIGDGYRAKNSELSQTGLPFARAGNINNGFQFTEADHFPSDALSRVGNKVSQPGDVVFTSKGTVGRFAFVREDTMRFVYSPQLCFWRSLDQSLIQSRFLYYWMHGSEFFAQFKGVAGQTDMAEYVSLTDQRRMHITLPQIAAQRAIAHILGTLDDKIELNRRMNETLEAMARALFKSWFSCLDTLRVEAAELIRQGVLEIGDGYRAKNSELGDQGLPFIRAGNLNNGFDTEGAEVLRHDSVAKTGNKVSRPGDVAFTSKGTIGRFARVTQFTQPFVYSPQVCFWRSLNHKQIQPALLYCWMQSGDLKAQIDAVAGQTDMAPYVSLQDQRKMEVPVFPEDQDVIAGHIDAILARQALCIEESKTLSAIRDTLLPKLISGELRVKDAERFIERGCQSTARNSDSYMT